MRPVERGGYGLDAGWNDDFHHVGPRRRHGARRVLLRRLSRARRRSSSRWSIGATFIRASGTPASKRFRGTPGLDLDAAQFVTFLQNHDQVANSPASRRLHQLTSPGRHRALTALLLPGPGHAAVVSRAGVLGPSPFYVLRRPRAGPGQAGPAGTLERCASSAARPARISAEQFRRSERPASRSSGRSWIGRERERTTRRWTCTATCCGCGAKTRCFLPSVPIEFRCGDRRRGILVAITSAPTATIGCCWSISDASSTGCPKTDPLAVPPEGRQWEVLWSSEDPAIWRLRHCRPWTPAVVFAGHAAFVSWRRSLASLHHPL